MKPANHEIDLPSVTTLSHRQSSRPRLLKVRGRTKLLVGTGPLVHCFKYSNQEQAFETFTAVWQSNVNMFILII